MRAALELECIGDDTRDKFRLYEAVANHVGCSFGKNPWAQPWVARLTGPDATYEFAREFLKGQKDYSRANSIGSRGVFLLFLLEEGHVYEVFARSSWKQSRRYFCTVRAGKVAELTREEVETWLENEGSASTC